MLVSQTVESVWLSALYPVNAMRNRALANARTDAVLLLDVDFWPSAGARGAGFPGGRPGRKLAAGAGCLGWLARQGRAGQVRCAEAASCAPSGPDHG